MFSGILAIALIFVEVVKEDHFQETAEALEQEIRSDTRTAGLMREQDKNAALEQRIAELERLATQRGARMQIMANWMYQMKLWPNFLLEYPDAGRDWFDADGVPVEGK